MQTPPADMLPVITSRLAKAMHSLPEDRHGALFWIATTEGINLAVVQRVPGLLRRTDFTITGYIGKAWGEPLEAGVIGSATW